MTQAHTHHRRSRRSRMLTSIFERIPEMTAASSRPAASKSGNLNPSLSKHRAERRPATWREAAAGAVRRSIAGDLCGNFFATAGRRPAATPDLSRADELMTAGQGLQALSEQAGPLSAMPESLAEVLELTGHADRRREADCAESVGASLQSLMTAKAA